MLAHCAMRGGYNSASKNIYRVCPVCTKCKDCIRGESVVATLDGKDCIRGESGVGTLDGKDCIRGESGVGTLDGKAERRIKMD